MRLPGLQHRHLQTRSNINTAVRQAAPDPCLAQVFSGLIGTRLSRDMQVQKYNKSSSRQHHLCLETKLKFAEPSSVHEVCGLGTCKAADIAI